MRNTFISIKNIHSSDFFLIKFNMHVNLRSYTKLEKSLALLIFTVYFNYCSRKYTVMDLNYEFLVLKFRFDK